VGLFVLRRCIPSLAAKGSSHLGPLNEGRKSDVLPDRWAEGNTIVVVPQRYLI
jgi:hypothetical protein